MYRVYCALRLNRARRTKRRVPRRPRVPLCAPPVLNQTWALHFMRNTLYDGPVFRTLNVLDQRNREGLAIDLGFSLPSRRVISLLDELVALHGAPRLDKGPEFLALRLTDWAEQRGIVLDFIQPGKPAQNAFIERFNQTYRTEVLDANLFSSLAEVRTITIAGSIATTPSGLTTALGECRPSCFFRGRAASTSPLMPCLLDGGAYPCGITSSMRDHTVRHTSPEIGKRDTA